MDNIIQFPDHKHNESVFQDKVLQNVLSAARELREIEIKIAEELRNTVLNVEKIMELHENSTIKKQVKQDIELAYERLDILDRLQQGDRSA